MAIPHRATILPPAGGKSGRGALSASLPPDLLEQVRKRIRTLAALMAAAFSFDPLLELASAIVSALGGTLIEPGDHLAGGFLAADVGAVAASLVLWSAARHSKISSTTLHTIGLVYEVAICLVMGLVGNWLSFIQFGHLPDLTWIPGLVMFFPLVLPGPPRRMLVAAIAAGAMAPVSIFLLSQFGAIDLQGNADPYVQCTVKSIFAVVFAWIGSKVVYGLGREVAAARELGSYQLEERLGQGGMGEVWRARHRLLARPSAIKLIRAGLSSSPEAVQRFEREAQAIAGLRSPHTVTLFDFGVAPDGAFYYVMELLEGLDADRMVRQHGPLAANRVVHVLRQVCHSLSEAESRGLVHRDIKPANIFLCRYGEEHDFVKVLDFGIVKTLRDPPAERGDLTRENVVPGSPHYMAPEQAMGEPNLDGRADLYAVGCVAYWMLTGKTVFDGESAVGQLVHHANTPPTPPSAKTTNPIPPTLEALIMRCLGKDPVSRPQTARELATALAAVAGSDAWTEANAREWWQANRM